MRQTLIALAALLAAGATAAVALGFGRPGSPPPKPAQPSGPPPAWVESATRSGWLDYGTYCWKTACADYIPPATRPGLRTFKANVGSTLRIHLGFTPKTLSARILPAKAFTTMPARPVATYRVKKLGLLEIQTRTKAGSASYVVQLVP